MKWSQYQHGSELKPRQSLRISGPQHHYVQARDIASGKYLRLPGGLIGQYDRRIGPGIAITFRKHENPKLWLMITPHLSPLGREHGMLVAEIAHSA